jgi:hypothetical protein
MRKVFLAVTVVVINLISWQGCMYETLPSPVNCDADPVILELVSVEDANCALKDGSAHLHASGGTGIYSFSVGENETQGDSVFLNLAAGTYDFSVRDNNGCSATLPATVKNKDGVNLTYETTNAGCNNSNGTIVVNAMDGIPPYQFKMDDSAFSTDNNFTDLFPGNYTVAVSDATGCENSQAVRVKSGISYSASVAGIIQNNCQVSSCHDGTQFPDFRVFKNIHDNAAQIKVLTGDRSMPQEGTLTQAQINMIACWVDDGALNN